MINFGFVFITLSFTIGVNLEDGFLNRMGFQPDVLVIAAVAFVITGLIVHRHLALIVLVVALILGANVPAEVAAGIGYNPDMMVAALFAIVIAPLFTRWFDAVPHHPQRFVEDAGVVSALAVPQNGAAVANMRANDVAADRAATGRHLRHVGGAPDRPRQPLCNTRSEERQFSYWDRLPVGVSRYATKSIVSVLSNVKKRPEKGAALLLWTSPSTTLTAFGLASTASRRHPAPAIPAVRGNGRCGVRGLGSGG